MKRLGILVVMLTLALATPAMAGIGKGNGELGFDFGGTNFDSDVTDKTGGRFVFRGGYHFTDLFELEGESGCSAASDSGVDITLCTTFVNGVFNFHSQSGEAVFYVLGGIGTAKLQFDFNPGKVDDNGSASHISVGARFFFGSSKKTAFRVELSSIREKTFDVTSDHQNLVGGFTWRLGRK